MVRWDRQKQVNSEFYSEEQVRRTLTASGLDIVNEVESHFITYCPFHNNYRTPASEIDKETGQFYCFGCQHSTTLPELVMFATKRNYFESLRLINSKGSSVNVSDEVSKILDKKDDIKEFDINTVYRLNSDALSSQRAAEYLKSRLITKDSVEKYLIGYSEKQDMITIPIFSPDNICVGMVGRSVEGKQFKNTPNLPRNKTFFNITKSKTASKIFLVESSFDAIRIEQAGGRAIASLGSSVSRTQRDLLKKYFSSIILVSDNDEAGRSMRDKLVQSLGSMVIPAELPDNIKDVSELNNSELEQYINQFDNEINYILNNL